MSKDTFWFKHDSNASRDIKLLKLKHIHGFHGIGLYWSVLEQLREQDGYKHPSDESSLQLLCGVIGEDITKFISFFNDCIRLEIFISKNNVFYSESMIKRMHNWEVNKENGSKGGSKKQANKIAKAYLISTETISECSTETSTKQSSKILPSREEKRREEKNNINNLPLHELNSFIANLPHVIKIQAQPTADECEKLISKYGITEVKETLTSMENRKGIEKDYTSVYLTCDKWCKRNNPNQPQQRKMVY